MLSNGKVLKILKAIFFVTVLCAALPKSVRAEDSANTGSDDRVLKSFLDYTPHPAQFPEELGPLASEIAAGETAQKPEDAAAHFRAAAGIAESLGRAINRGYQDQVFFLRGLIAEGMRQNAEAMKFYEKALHIRPNNMLALFRHAYLLKKSNRCTEALPELREIAWQVKPLSYELDYLIGNCLVSMDQKAEGLKSYQAAYQKNPNFLPVLREMVKTRSELLAQTPDPKKQSDIVAQLINDLSSITRQDPQDRDSALSLARYLLRVDDRLLDSNKLTRAETIVKKLAEDSNYKDDVSVHLLFQVEVKRGDLHAAEDVLKRGLDANAHSKELAAAKQQLEIEKSVKQQADGGDNA
jgi:tetratricopeptide (TPR) repeat protein